MGIYQCIDYIVCSSIVNCHEAEICKIRIHFKTRSSSSLHLFLLMFYSNDCSLYLVFIWKFNQLQCSLFMSFYNQRFSLLGTKSRVSLTNLFVGIIHSFSCRYFQRKFGEELNLHQRKEKILNTFGESWLLIIIPLIW